MPDISQQQVLAAELIRSQIEGLENASQTLPYWSLYQAITGGSGGGGGSTDVSLLAKELTLAAVSDKLPALSSGRIPVGLLERILTPDKRLLTANTIIPEGSIYAYLKVVTGEVTVDGLTYLTGEYINYEPCYPYKHPEINLVIPAGKSVRLDRGF